MNRFIFFLVLFCPLLAFAATPQTPFELRDGDRVVFIGDTLIEREKDYGYIELMMTLRFPERNVTFRNLGWSADTPEGISRVSFDWSKGSAEWFRQLVEQIKQTQPTVVVLGYGMASSLEDAAATELERQMGIESVRVGGDRVPPQGEGDKASSAPAKQSASTAQTAGERSSLSPGERAGVRGTGASAVSPRLDKFVRDYEKLIDAILELNKETRFVLLSPIRHEKLPPPLPDPDVASFAPSRETNGSPRTGEGGEVGRGMSHNQVLALYTKAIQRIAEKRGFRFVPLFGQMIGINEHSPKQNRIEAMTDNGIHLNGWGYQVAAFAIASGLWGTQDYKPLDQFEPLRQAIIKKNRTFFHRWRPQNSTYLFLFRKHEQGRNAQEIPQFDPLVAAEEEKIAKLRREPPQQITNHETRITKPKQNPLPEHPQTPFKQQPKPEFTLADPNLEISLWAENPLLAKPIQMNWDARGRLFVASSSAYPQIAPGQPEEDKILIIEDTDNDGKADKTTVFADGLLIPSAVEPGDGGAYVGQSTELLHFADTNGDGIADERRVVLSGFGTEDTHHTLHTLRWGPDGQLNMNQSIYIHSHIETPHGVVRLNSGGTLQLRPDTLELGVLMKGLVNGWGHAIDDFGQSFQTDGAGGQGINWIVPQAMYVTYAGARRILGSVSPGSYPKFCGLEIIKSEHFPKEWQGGFVTCDFRANRMVRFEISDLEGQAPRVPDQNNNRESAGNQNGTRGTRPSSDGGGAGYVTKQYEFLRTTNITFRPIDVKLGPDGALYIADWSNPIIQHGEVDFRDARRDREHGRIWRVSYKGGRKVEKPELVKASNKELLEQLLSPNRFNEAKARRILVERHTSYPAVRGLLNELDAWSNAGDTEAKLEAAFLREALAKISLHAADRVPSPVFYLEQLLKSEDGRARAAAVRLIGALAGNTPGIPSLAQPKIGPNVVLDLLSKFVDDPHGRVRMEVVRALARIPTARSAELALSVLDVRSSGRESAPTNSGGNDQSRLTSAATSMDPFLEYALWLTINDLAEPWAAAVESGAWKIEGREKQLHYALKAIEPKLATRLMAKVIGDKPLPRDGSGGMIELIGQAGGPEQLRKLFDQILNGGFSDAAMVSALNSLTEAARLRNVRPTGDLAPIIKLLGLTTPHPNPLPVEGRGNQTGAPQNPGVRPANSAVPASNDGRNGDRKTVPQNPQPGAAASPSPLNGERAGVRGGPSQSNIQVQAAAARLAGAWKLQSATPSLTAIATDANAPRDLRMASIDGLRELGGRQAVNALRTLTKDGSGSIRMGAAAALASTDLNVSMPQILEVVSALTNEDEALSLWRSLIAVREASSSLTKALATNSLPEKIARAGLRAAREGGRNEPNLVLALNKAGSLSDPSAALTDNEIHAISYEVTKGDPANGEKLYRRPELGCVMCHSIGGAGGKVGPDMTSLGVSTPLVNYIVESVLLPNKKVKEGYNSVQIVLKDGDEVTGNLVREDNEQVILRDATAREVSVPKRNIASRQMGGSIMPAGLVDYITPQERLDLYAFLKELGKPGPYDATKQNVARVWRLNPKVGTVNADEMLKSDLRGQDWMPLIATVSGTLPKADVMSGLEGKDATVWLASRFQTSKSGPAKFKVSGTPSPKAWIDGKPIGGDGDLTVELPAGAHTFFLKVTTTDIASGLKLESNDVTFLME